MEEAERLCDRIAIIDHGRIIAEGTSEELVASAFGTRSEVTARFSSDAAAASRMGLLAAADRSANRSRSSRSNAPQTLHALLDDASTRGIAIEDVTLRRPNLESVFLHLTGRELRD